MTVIQGPAEFNRGTFNVEVVSNDVSDVTNDLISQMSIVTMTSENHWKG